MKMVLSNVTKNGHQQIL